MFAFWISCYCLTGCVVSDVWICVAILVWVVGVAVRVTGVICCLFWDALLVCWLTLCLGLGGVVPSLRFWFSALGFGALM